MSDDSQIHVEGTGSVDVPDPTTDKTTVRIVVVGIAALVALVVVCAFVLTMKYPDRHLPEPLVTMAVGLSGALAGILATTRSHQ